MRVLPIHVPPCYEGGYLKPTPLKPHMTYDGHLADPSMFHDAVRPWSLHMYHYEAMQGQVPHVPPTKNATIQIHKGGRWKGVKMSTSTINLSLELWIWLERFLFVNARRNSLMLHAFLVLAAGVPQVLLRTQYRGWMPADAKAAHVKPQHAWSFASNLNGQLQIKGNSLQAMKSMFGIVISLRVISLKEFPVEYLIGWLLITTCSFIGLTLLSFYGSHWEQPALTALCLEPRNRQKTNS